MDPVGRGDAPDLPDAAADRRTGDPGSPDGDDAREVRAALALSAIDELGPARYGELVERFGSARAVLARAARPSAGRDPDLAGLRGVRPVSASRLAALRERGIRVVAYGTPGYPGRLTHLHHPPPVLYLEGPASLPAGRAVAIVGTRRATGYGRRMARDLAADFAARGWSVVSGMAAGIDGAAHRGALAADGPTVGVLGSGLDHEYPSVNRPLYREMRRSGLLVSEFPPAHPPAAGLFPRRNRIIAALAEAVVVVQAGERSGARITADHALDIGREVFAVPGPVGPPASVGVHALLRQGAAPATCADDVVRALGREGDGGGGPPGEERTDGDGPAFRLPGRDRLAARFGRDADAAEALCRQLIEGPRTADDLAKEGGLEVATASSLLVQLELEGWIRGLPGNRFELVRRDPPSARA